MCFDAVRGRLVVFGGFTADGRVGDTREWDGSIWHHLKGDGPPGRAEHDGAFLPGRGFVIFGGVIGDEMEVENRVLSGETWIWNGETWRQVAR